MTPELSRPFPLTRLGHGIDIIVNAKPEECEALAQRMGVPAIARLTCKFDLVPVPTKRIRAIGRLETEVTQICVITLEAFESIVIEDFVVNFVPAGTESEELDLDAEDEIPYEGDTLDLGEATAEQLALALDPFPRKPGAEMPGEFTESPLTALAAVLRERKQ